MGGARLRAVIILLSVVFGLGAVMVGGGLLYGWYQFEKAGPPAPFGNETVVLFERGTSVSAMAARLEQAGVIDDALLFKLGARVSGVAGDMKAGEYAIPSGASMADIMDLLVQGKSIQHKITVAEGLSVAQVFDLVREHKALSGEITKGVPEGLLLPETYLFHRGEDRDILIARMVKAKKDLVKQLWPLRADDLPIDTPMEAVILASIVEKETGVAEERPMVASVFVNRLRKGIRLQSDPTIIYGITKGRPLGRRIRRSELNAKTPYNTYQVSGLPPTAIANPGRASLEAVLNPPESDYYYFVADGTGGHAFARTLAEHNRNVAKWRRFQRENGLR